MTKTTVPDYGTVDCDTTPDFNEVTGLVALKHLEEHHGVRLLSWERRNLTISKLNDLWLWHHPGLPVAPGSEVEYPL